MVKKAPASDTILAFVADEASEAVIKELPIRDYGMSLVTLRGNAKTAFEN